MFMPRPIRGRERINGEMSMQIFFDILFSMYVVLYFPVLVLRGKWHNGFAVRFGKIPADVCQRLRLSKNIWVHAVSVGEVVAVEGVIKGLMSAYPGYRIVLTVTTKTGHALAIKKYEQTADVLWSPLDLSWVVGTFVRVIDPVFYVVAETELWPNLFTRLAKNKVPLFVLNGRISDAAYPKYRWARWFFRLLLRRVTFFCMQSPLDARRIVALGAPEERVVSSGNVKFDNVFDAVSVAPSLFGYRNEDVIFVAGSTHPGEEKVMLDAYKELRLQFPLLRLVLAPRHPERATPIAEEVRAKGFSSVFLSKRGNSLMGRNDVLVVDEIGQMMPLYSVATVVFVGKSLTRRGGHNIIEPAVFAKPIIIGPYMDNFKDITSIFLENKALVQISDAGMMQKTLSVLLADPARRMDIGNRARVVVEQNRGAAERMIKVITDGVSP